MSSTERLCNARFEVTGMSCASCVGTVERTLKSMNGVKSASVNLSTNGAMATYDGAVLDTDDIINGVEDMGFNCTLLDNRPINGDNNANRSEAKFEIGGMTCASCVGTVERSLKGTNGVLVASVNLATNSATVTYDYNVSTADIIVDIVETVGFDCTLIENRKLDAETDCDTKRVIIMIDFIVNCSVDSSPSTDNSFMNNTVDQLPMLVTALEGMIGVLEVQANNLEEEGVFDVLLFNDVPCLSMCVWQVC